MRGQAFLRFIFPYLFSQSVLQLLHGIVAFHKPSADDPRKVRQYFYAEPRVSPAQAFERRF
jgi:hypothetical protein